jgi:hypothetical protein
MKKSNLREWIYDVLKEGGYKKTTYAFFNHKERHYIHMFEIEWYINMDINYL